MLQLLQEGHQGGVMGLAVSAQLSQHGLGSLIIFVQIGGHADMIQFLDPLLQTGLFILCGGVPHNAVTGQTQAQDIAEESVSVKLDRFRDVTVAVTSKELSLDIADFSRQVVEPAMQAIAQAIDEDLLAVAVSQAAMKKAGDKEASDLADIAELAKHLDLAKAPMANRALVLHPEHKYRYALTENLSNVAYAGDNETLRNALLGRIYTLDTYMDQNAPDTAAAAPVTVPSA